MNVFFVPRLGSMIYTMNGRTDATSPAGRSTGQLPGHVGNFSGDGFSDMHFVVRARHRTFRDLDRLGPQARAGDWMSHVPKL